MKFSPGLANPRAEDARFLAGRGRYADDVALEGQAHAVMIRSPHGHARILGIDAEAALAAPGVLAVLTAADWAADGMGALHAPGHMMRAPLPRPDGTPYVNPDRLPLPVDRVRFVGEAVAMVVADSPARAADAADLVGVDYELLPAVIEATGALAEGAPVVSEDVPGNAAFIYRAGDAAAVEAAIATAPHVIRQRLANNRIHANPMEPLSINALHDPGRDRYTIWGSCHRAFDLRDMLADKVLRVGRDRVDVVPGDLGGSFGLKGSIPVEMALTPWAARRVGRPVKWTATRSEMIVADNHARDMASEAEIAFDDAGRILALRSRNLNNLGAHIEFFGMAPAVMNVGGMAGPYAIPALFVEVVGVFTNTSPTAPYRGSGRPEATYVVERMIDLAAARLGLDPAEMRRRNLIPEDALPYRTGLTFTYDSGEFEKVLDKALAAADYAGFPGRRAEAAARGRLRGIGVAMSIESAGGPGSEHAALKFAPDGGVAVLAGTTNHGQGHETLFVQYVSERLGLDPATIRVVESDTREVRAGTGSGGSRSAAFASAAIEDAIGKAIARGRPIAAHLLQAGEGSVTFAEGAYHVAGSGRRIPFVEVARAAFAPDALPEGAPPGLHEEGVARLEKPTFPNGCQICELEIDPESGSVEIVAHTVCDDVGFEINPLIVKGQILGGVAQGVGQALMEDLRYDEEGQVLTGSFMDYAMPRAADFGRIAVMSHPVPTKVNPTGVKGVGESGTVGALAAVMNAVNDALAPLGAGPIDMPATPQRVWRAIREAGRD